MAKFIVSTPEELQLHTSGKNLKRPGSSRDWRRWLAGDRSLVLTVCYHDSVREWDCGCSYGCQSCRITHVCSDCGKSFFNNRAWLNEPSMTLTERANMIPSQESL